MRQASNSSGPANSTVLVHETLPHKSGSIDIDPEVAAALAKQYKRSLGRSHRYHQRLQKLNARFLEERSHIISDRTLRRLQKFQKKQRASVYGLADVAPENIDNKRLRAAKRDASKKASEMMKRADVDVDQLRRLYKKAARKTHSLLGQTFKPVQKIRSVPLTDGRRMLHDTPDAFVKKPPFENLALWHYFHSEEGIHSWEYGVDVIHNPFKYITGRLYHRSRWENYSAGYVDTFVLNSRASVGFRYTPPAPGPRQVFVRVFVETSRADVWLDDEFDFSYNFTSFDSRFEIDVSKMPGLQGATDFFSANAHGEPDDEWRHETLIADNTEMWLPFTINFPPDNFFIWITAQNIHSTGLGDVSTDATMTVRYRIEEVVIV